MADMSFIFKVFFKLKEEFIVTSHGNIVAKKEITPTQNYIDFMA